MQRFAARAGAPLAASATLTVGLLALHSLFSSLPFPPTTIAQWLVHVLPGGIETRAIETLGTWASKLLTSTTTLGWLIAVTVVIARLRHRPAKQPIDTSRRSFVRNGVLLGAGIALGGVTILRSLPRAANKIGGLLVSLGQVRRARTPPLSESDLSITSTPGLAGEITPNERFYVVSESLVDPHIDSPSWKLKIHGMVKRPYTLSYEELIALPAVEEFVTLECISNHVGGQLISTALWRGVPVTELLDRARLQPGATGVLTRGAGDYATDLPIARVQQPKALVVYGMNGRALPQAHGFPARMLVPGLYGMKNCKWLTEIEVTGRPALGYWETRGWSDEASVRTTSRIDTPISGSNVAPGTPLSGMAFAGDRGIDRVELSLDDGRTWAQASLARALSKTTWVQWKYFLPISAKGEINAVVRAVDGTGMIQDKQFRPPHPSGAGGYHEIGFTVR